MAADCVSLHPKPPRHKYHTVSYQARKVIDHFCQHAPAPAGGTLAAGKNADQARAAARSLARLLDSPDFPQRMARWADARPPPTRSRKELADFAADTLRRWHEYLTQCGGYRLGHG